MILTAVLSGITLGGLGAWPWVRKMTDNLDKVKAILLAVTTATMSMPLLISSSNRLLATAEPEMVEVEFVTEQPFFASRFGVIEGEEIVISGYKIFFYLEDDLHWMTSRQTMFPQNKRGDKVLLELQSGFWGFRYFPIQDLKGDKLI